VDGVRAGGILPGNGTADPAAAGQIVGWVSIW
jgi:hypothetical protein